MVKQLQTQRFQFLKSVYELSEGSIYVHIDGMALGDQLNIANTEGVIEYLVAEGLIEPAGLGGGVRIAHAGIKEVEAALSRPEEPTEHFPPVGNMIYVQNMVGSVIQQGSQGSTATVTFTGNTVNDIAPFLESLKNSLDKLGLNDESKGELVSEIQTAEVQLNSPKPKASILFETLKSIRTILEGAAGGIIATGLQGQLNQILTLF